MKVNVLLFARLRRAAGRAAWTLECDEPEGGLSVREAAERCAAEFGLDLRGVMAAVNERYAQPADRLRDGDELALVPPVSGGAPDDLLLLTSEPLDLAGLHARLIQPECGAQAAFTGSTRTPDRDREIAALTYEAYEAMTRREMAAIAAEARERWPLGTLVIAHRLGRVAAGEVSLFVGVGSAHRAPGLAALPWIVDEVKRRLPVWKLEEGPGGEAWVAGTSQAAPPLEPGD
ncbi:MAG TPA: molybdenum cofactor biosynthesis protein MoaE [Deinococcales bacterium]|nr:molybdenum cofactor biosynthesis protein MoaE [Deinococcales bacterium]